MNPRLLIPFVFATVYAGGLAATAYSAPEEPALAIAKKQAEAYKAAFDKGDAAALAKLFTEDAQYSDDSGETTTGRAEIEKQTAAFFSDSSGMKIEIQVESARLLTPDVLVEKGIAMISGSGDPQATRYTATQVKEDDKWLIADLYEFVPPGGEPGIEALTELEWMIGKWKVDSDEVKATMEAIWTLDGRFITRTTTIEQEPREPFVSVEVIGYDPTQGQIRSWMFDNEGGFGSGTWRRDGNKWLIRARSTSPRNELSSSQHVVTVIDETAFGLTSINRIIDGQLLPNRDLIKIVRTAEEK